MNVDWGGLHTNSHTDLHVHMDHQLTHTPKYPPTYTEKHWQTRATRPTRPTPAPMQSLIYTSSMSNKNKIERVALYTVMKHE